MFTLFTSLKSLSLGIKLLELAYKLTLFLIGNDNCEGIVNEYELNLCAHRPYKNLPPLGTFFFLSHRYKKKRT